MRMMKNPETKPLMENILDMYQLHLGLEHDILEKPELYSYTDCCWLKELMTAMDKFSIQIYRPNRFKIQPQRYNDTTIMQLVKSRCNDVEFPHINT